MKIRKGKIIKEVFFKCIYSIIILCFLYNIIFSINTTIFKKDYLKIIGISVFCMQNNLMQDDVGENDIIVTRQVNQKELEKGDIIAYTINGKIRINKIVNLKDGYYTTKSNKNYNPDIEKLEYSQIIGKMILKISAYGFIIKVLQSKITTFIILLILILGFLYNKYLFKKREIRTIKKQFWKEKK